MPYTLTPFGFRRKAPHVGPHYGDLYARSVAAAIDVMLLYWVLGPITAHVMREVYAAFGQGGLGNDRVINNFTSLFVALWDVRYPFLIGNGIALLMMGILIVSCQIAFGTTPGKWLIGLKIVDSKTLEPIARWRYVFRFIAYIPAAVSLVGMFCVPFNKQRRGLHDYLCGTAVINLRPSGWYWDKIKQGYRWLRGKSAPSAAVENTVAEPTTEKRHEDGDKPV